MSKGKGIEGVDSVSSSLEGGTFVHHWQTISCLESIHVRTTLPLQWGRATSMIHPLLRIFRGHLTATFLARLSIPAAFFSLIYEQSFPVPPQTSTYVFNWEAATRFPYAQLVLWRKVSGWWLWDALTWSRSHEEWTMKEVACLHHVAPVSSDRYEGDTSESRHCISEVGLHSEVVYLNGCLKLERGWVDSLRMDMRILRARLVALSSRLLGRKHMCDGAAFSSLMSTMRMNSLVWCAISWKIWRRVLSIFLLPTQVRFLETLVTWKP